MNGRRHLYALAAALMAFGILTMMSGAFGLPELVTFLVLAAVCTALYFHYRRKAARTALVPVTPSRDPHRMPPKDVEFAVILRDEGKCQLKFPGICLVDQKLTVDHIYPWSLGGSSTDMDNLQTACRPCNQHKGAKVLV